MAFDVERDVRRLRRGLAIAALLLLGAFCFAGVRGLAAPWRSYQEELGAADTGIVELRSCDGSLDRCATCHLGALRSRAAISSRDASRSPSAVSSREAMSSRDALGEVSVSAGAPPASGAARQPMGAAHPDLLAPHPDVLAAHPPHLVGCTACHGGTGRALTTAQAHALPGTGELDPLLSGAYQEATCSRCHVPGAVAGTERVVRGVDLFLELGCAMCHSLSPEGRGGWDFGPDLRTLGRRTVARLKSDLLDPGANFPGTTMPSFAATFAGREDELESLLVYVQSLTLPPGCPRPASAGRWVAAPCSTCHAGEKGRAGGRLAHRCVYLLTRREELACARCHDGALPAAAPIRDCPVVREHRSACAACHGGEK